MIEPTRIITARETPGGPDEPWEESLGLFRPAGAGEQCDAQRARGAGGAPGRCRPGAGPGVRGPG
ncbi:hypothetical protein PV350_23430, partial [Streptomyces sp. PA03-6a]|nr:hypothetical protein [Streptomyces sp. PA03-6a]